MPVGAVTRPLRCLRLCLPSAPLAPGALAQGVRGVFNLLNEEFLSSIGQNQWLVLGSLMDVGPVPPGQKVAMNIKAVEKTL